ncbi:hypothetical protein L1987_05017 [Smallanthus sonchifolius]|uniref:Uncharacterized protein n=2 Tax=Smallanthus sonchifolius TaxID=185202 RepID=A0ACB9CB44_9ASTR|nr:hypothetical protein L1987_62570 [Smallanthus sonchifolius]KAI3823578.1 hypothetical protein L1987_05017 [Smallanthus sonchifolius]
MRLLTRIFRDVGQRHCGELGTTVRELRLLHTKAMLMNRFTLRESQKNFSLPEVVIGAGGGCIGEEQVTKTSSQWFLNPLSATVSQSTSGGCLSLFESKVDLHLPKR